MNKSLTATLKYALVSDKKMSLMAKLIKWKTAQEALNTLAVLPKKAAKILLKVVKSAYSNAKAAWEGKEFAIKEVKVWAGPKIKRVRFSSRSRISHYEKSRCFVQVLLVETASKVKKAVAKVEKADKPVKAPKAKKATK